MSKHRCGDTVHRSGPFPFCAFVPFRADEWLLYSEDSPSASGGRGFTRGALYDRAGHLVASVAQEGLIRMRKTP